MADSFVHNIMGLSGDFLNHVDCKDIMNDKTNYDQWEFIYFGSEEAL